MITVAKKTSRTYTVESIHPGTLRASSLFARRLVGNDGWRNTSDLNIRVFAIFFASAAVPLHILGHRRFQTNAVEMELQLSK